jgi:hypothetical protein
MVRERLGSLSWLSSATNMVLAYVYTGLSFAPTKFIISMFCSWGVKQTWCPKYSYIPLHIYEIATEISITMLARTFKRGAPKVMSHHDYNWILLKPRKIISLPSRLHNITGLYNTVVTYFERKRFVVPSTRTVREVLPFSTYKWLRMTCCGRGKEPVVSSIWGTFSSVKCRWGGTAGGSFAYSSGPGIGSLYEDSGDRGGSNPATLSKFSGTYSCKQKIAILHERNLGSLNVNYNEGSSLDLANHHWSYRQ